MSPEHDNNPQPSAIETSPAEPTTGIQTGAATAVARAPETPEPIAAEANSVPLGTSAIEVGAEAPAAEVVSTDATPAPESAEAKAAEASDAPETSETSET